MTDAMTSWTWPGCEGKQAEVEVYARAASAALVLNGKEIARKNAKNDCLFRFRCAYQPGTLEAVAYNAAGQETGRWAMPAPSICRATAPARPTPTGARPWPSWKPAPKAV